MLSDSDRERLVPVMNIIGWSGWSTDLRSPRDLEDIELLVVTVHLYSMDRYSEKLLDLETVCQ